MPTTTKRKPKRLSKAQKIASKLNVNILTRGRIVVIGCGGIGSWLIRALSVFLASIGTEKKPIKMLLVDGDFFTPDNAYRVDIPEYTNKAIAFAEELEDKKTLAVEVFPHFVTDENVVDLIKDGDAVFLCVDNHATRRTVNQMCCDRANTLLISGGNDGIDKKTDGTCGNVQVCLLDKSRMLAGGRDLEQLHAEISTSTDKNPADMSCIEFAMSGDPQLCFTNFAVASAMCNALWRVLALKKQDKVHAEYVLDIYEGVLRPVPGID